MKYICEVPVEVKEIKLSNDLIFIKGDGEIHVLKAGKSVPLPMGDFSKMTFRKST